MIAWRYLDKASATVAALRDYISMQAIIANTPEEIKIAYENMTVPRNAVVTDLPSVKNPKAGEEKLAAQIDQLDILRSRYSSAVEYMAWFDPAWSALTDTERLILREFHMGESARSGATARIECELGCSDRHIRRVKERALAHLEILLFG